MAMSIAFGLDNDVRDLALNVVIRKLNLEEMGLGERLRLIGPDDAFQVLDSANLRPNAARKVATATKKAATLRSRFSGIACGRQLDTAKRDASAFARGAPTGCRAACAPCRSDGSRTFGRGFGLGHHIPSRRPMDGRLA